MNLKSRIIKQINRLANARLRVDVWLLVKIFGFPTIGDGYSDIYRRGFILRRLFKEADFTTITEKNWGSAFPNMDNIFVKKAVIWSGDTILLQTKLEVASGLDFKGKSVMRSIISGKTQSKELLPPVGMYSAVISMDRKALGSWDAWWFNEEHKNDDGYKYKCRELDMIERFFIDRERATSITTTVHRGVSRKEDLKMYNSKVDIGNDISHFLMAIEFVPNRNRMRIYINGVKVFVGYQWKMIAPLRMIFNNGILGGYQQQIQDNLLERPYYLGIAHIKHYNK